MCTATLFVACPIGPEDSQQRKRADRLLEHIITPVANLLEIDVIRADQIPEPGHITDQLTIQIRSADVLIADVSDLNANVMFELGVRAGLRRPFVLLAEAGQVLPFDVHQLRTVFYRFDIDAVADVQRQLREQLEVFLSDLLNPVFDPLRVGEGNAGASIQDVELLAKNIESYLTRLERGDPPRTMASFRGIRQYVNNGYTDALLWRVLHNFPDRLRAAQMHGDQTGITRAR